MNRYQLQTPTQNHPVPLSIHLSFSIVASWQSVRILPADTENPGDTWTLEEPNEWI